MGSGVGGGGPGAERRKEGRPFRPPSRREPAGNRSIKEKRPPGTASGESFPGEGAGFLPSHATVQGTSELVNENRLRVFPHR